MDKIWVGDLDSYTVANKSLELPSGWFETFRIFLTEPSDAVVQWYKSQGYEGSEDGGVYTLQKDFLQKKVVLDEMMQDFTTELNFGRELNQDRYNDIIAVWESTLDKTEIELNSLEDDEDSFETLMITMAAAIQTDYSTHETTVGDLLDDWGDAQRQVIDDRFDESEAKIQAGLISNGLYNTNTWAAIQTGLTRDETIADTDLEDKITQRQLELKERLYAKLITMRQGFIAARHQLMAVLHSQANARTALRNRVIEAIAGFAERRTDEYPSYLEIQKAALDVAKMELH